MTAGASHSAAERGEGTAPPQEITAVIDRRYNEALAA